MRLLTSESLFSMTTSAATPLTLRTDSAVRAAKGRWPAIFASCGMDGSHFVKQGRPCPVCGGTDRFSFTDRWGRGNFICRGCGSGDGFDLISRYCQCGFIEALEVVERFCGISWQGEKADARVELTQAQIKEKEQARERMKLWSQAHPIVPGDPVWTYLAVRGLTPSCAGLEVRYHPALSYNHEDGTVTQHPAMLARVIDRHGVVINLHRTYLDEKGAKADLPKPKKLMSGAAKGGAVHFGGEVGDVLGLAEGIETAIAVHQKRSIPVWATLGCTNMHDFMGIPSGVKRLLVFADNDAKFAGQAAAYALAHRLATSTSMEVTVLVPPIVGTDWLDELIGRAGSRFH